MSLRDKYAAAIQVAKSVGMQGGAEEANGRLQFKGTVRSEDDKNKIWDALKTVPTWKDELNAQIDVTPQAAATSAKSASTTYTVQSGDTLSRIASTHLGDAGAYMKIFEANRDKLSDPDKIQVGQVLTIPSA